MFIAYYDTRERERKNARRPVLMMKFLPKIHSSIQSFSYPFHSVYVSCHFLYTEYYCLCFAHFWWWFWLEIQFSHFCYFVYDCCAFCAKPPQRLQKLLPYFGLTVKFWALNKGNHNESCEQNVWKKKSFFSWQSLPLKTRFIFINTFGWSRIFRRHIFTRKIVI